MTRATRPRPHPHGRGRGRDGAVSAVLLPVSGALAMVGVWWAAIVVLGIESYLAPTPPQVASAFADSAGYLLANAKVTVLEVVQGYAITVVLGIAAGALMAISATMRRVVMPTVIAVNAIPKLAFAPLLLVWMGFGQGPKIVMVVLVCFFPIVLATTTGLTHTPAELTELARSLTASRWQTLVRIRLPAALPQIFVGLKTAMPLAVIGALVGEMSGATAGLGWIILTTGPDIGLAFAAITLLAILSVTLITALGHAERLLLPWTQHTTN